MDSLPREDAPLSAASFAAKSATKEKKRKRRDDHDDEDIDDEDDEFSTGVAHDDSSRAMGRLPPSDYRRYIALWEEERRYERRRRQQQQQQLQLQLQLQLPNTDRKGDAGTNASGGDDPAAAASDASNVLDHDANLQKWVEELELARHVCRIRGQIHDEHRRRRRAGQVEAGEQSVAARLERELTGLLALPRVYQRSYDHNFWNEALPREIKHSKELAWAMLRANESLPVSFQKMLWMDRTCPLRGRREILVTSIDKGLHDDPPYRVVIAWNEGMVDDRELVLKCFEKCPGCISAGTVPDLMKPYLSDMEALRAFAFAPNPSCHRKWGCANGREGIHAHFAPTMFKDPEFMADLVVHMFRHTWRDAWGLKVDEWARLRLEEAFPHLCWKRGTPPARGEEEPIPKASVKGLGVTLLDNVDFAIRVANGLFDLPPERRLLCPVTYAALTDRVRCNPQVAVAFARIATARDFFDSVPPSLKRDGAFWGELWTNATDRDPLAIFFHESFKATPCKSLLSSKGLALRCLEASRTQDDPTRCLQEFTKFVPNFSLEIQHDREINMQWVVSWAAVPLPDRAELVAPAPQWIQRRDFWIDLAETLACPCAAWSLVPEGLADDEGLRLVWARRARPDGAIGWLAGAVERFPLLDLLSDRKILLNWLPQLCSDDSTATALRSLIPQECLDCAFWIELFQDLNPPRNLLGYIPEKLRSDPGIVDAQLRCSAKDDAVLAESFGMLSPALGERFSPRIVHAIQKSDVATFYETWHHPPQSCSLYSIPDVVFARLSKGGKVFPHFFMTDARRNDPDFLVSLAAAIASAPSSNQTRIGTFTYCCSEALRRDKKFVLRVLKRTNLPPFFLFDDLRDDFDVKCAVYSHHTVSELRDFLNDGPREEVCRFTRLVRSRVESYVPLEAFMTGVESDRSLGPVSLLGQDHDTVMAFRQRLIEYLGCPSSSRDEASDLRRLSNKLTLAGY